MLVGAVSWVPHLALAVAVVCGCAFLAGRSVARLGQPRVIGEIAAGILLGPTLLGAVWPGAFQWLFPHEILHSLRSLARLGVILFVFFVGLEFASALAHIRWRVVGALVVGSFAVPLLLGTAIAFPLFDRLGGDGASRTAFVLFFGVALSITAVPVLASILEDVGLLTRPLGRLAFATAAVTDVAAWCFLALAAAKAGDGNTSTAFTRLLETAALAAGVLVIGRPLLRRCFRLLPRALVRIVYPVAGVALAIGLADLTQHIGVSVLFGALLAGLALGPELPAASRLLGQIRLVNRYLLLPIFFVATGLLIDLGSAGSVHLLWAGALVLAVASLGKIGGVFIAARASGLPVAESLGLGFLLNTKGLTEIVVLRIGYDLGLISHDALGVLIVVALVATAAAVPVIRALGLVPARQGDRLAPANN
jgi:Kef-type K+ transport system membrane component KefB